MGKAETLKDYCDRTDLSTTLTISELEVQEFDGKNLSKDKLEALSIYRKYRIDNLLRKTGSEVSFNKSYEHIRSLSNLVDYKEFLNKDSLLF